MEKKFYELPMIATVAILNDDILTTEGSKDDPFYGEGDPI